MKIWPLLLAGTLACQGKPKNDIWQDIPAPKADAGIKLTNPHGPPKPAIEAPPTDWAACDAALATAPKQSALRRVQHIVSACKVCGDWKPLLEWNKEARHGGPTSTQIENAMLACKAYCDANAKQRFVNTLDRLRGKGTRGPWRFLGEMCKGAVSAVPDNRYAGAPYFALDRIARAAAGRPESAKLLEAIELPMPLVSLSGYGYDLARSAVTAPDAGPLALTVMPNELRIAAVPTAKLTKDGVVVGYKGEPYPGALIKSAKDLAAEVAKMGKPLDAGSAIAIFAPRALAATRILDALKVTGERPVKPAAKAPYTIRGDVRLAVGADGGLPGWALSGSIPIALRTTPGPDAVKIVLGDSPDAAIEELKKHKATLLAATRKLKGVDDPSGPPAALITPVLVIELLPTAKVEDLAKLLGAAGYFDVKSVALAIAKAAPQ